MFIDSSRTAAGTEHGPRPEEYALLKGLLERYWPKLVRSYAAEAITTRVTYGTVNVGAAQAFVDLLEGRREVSETEPGVFRQTEVTGDGYRVFELTSLLPKTGFELHIAKMVQ